MKSFVWIWALLALIVIGCGGSNGPTDGTTTGRGQVSGILFDRTGSIVSNARVWTNTVVTRETTSNPAGAYVLQGVAGTDIIVQAEVFRNGQRFYGQNLATITANQRQPGINISLFPDNQLGQLRGTIMDTSGNLLRGIRVFAKPTDASFGTSSVAISNASGQFVMNGLGAGINYQVQANGQGYNSATTIINLAAGESRVVDVTVPTGAVLPIAPPTNVSAQAWTMPDNGTRSKQNADALLAIKNYINPKAARANASVSRMTTFGNIVEVDLYWDKKLETQKLGYGIYRATGTGPFVDVAFLRDPLADFFAYAGAELGIGADYTFGVTTIDTLFDGVEGESTLSNTVTVSPLGNLFSASATAGNSPVFNWSTATGAATYQVFLYDELPTIGVTPLVTSPAITGTSWSLPSTLTTGKQYWFVVIGSNSFNDKTVSQLYTFVP